MDVQQRESQRLVEYASLFKNALVYTVVMTNVKIIMEGHDGSVSLLLLAFVVASTLALKLEMNIGKIEAGVSHNEALRSLMSLLCFVAALFSNVMVQFTSQLVAEAVQRSLQGTDVYWSCAGAALSIILIYVMNKIAAGAALSCVSAQLQTEIERM